MNPDPDDGFGRLSAQTEEIGNLIIRKESRLRRLEAAFAVASWIVLIEAAIILQLITTGN